MIRLVLVIALAVGAAGCEKKSARHTANEAIIAASGANFEKLNERLVSAAQLKELVACSGTQSEWMTPGYRRGWYRDLRKIVTDKFWRGEASVELVSIEPVDKDSWYIYDVGEAVADGCQAKKPFGTEAYQLTIAFTNKLGDRRESSFVVTMWTFDKNWHLWSSPLGEP